MRRMFRDDLCWVLVMMSTILAPVAINGCAEAPFSGQVTAKQALLGKSEADILACAGAPRTVSLQGGLKTLTYYKKGELLEGSFPGTKGGRSTEAM